jgi:esterase
VGVVDPASDEFELLAQNAREAGLDWWARPAVERVELTVDGQAISALAWGNTPPRVVLLHGGGQNAHTWDTVVLCLLATAPGLGVLAVDLPGHGHSDWRGDHDYRPATTARALTAALRDWGALHTTVVGMSLGGLATIRLAAVAPDLLRHAVIVDVTPSAQARRAEATPAEQGPVALIDGPDVFESFTDMLDATIAAAPNRSPASLRRAVLHNARLDEQGRWVWRYDRQQVHGDFATLWDDLSASAAPMTLVRGGRSPFVTDRDAAEFARRKPGLAQHLVPHAGHSIQSDAPLELAAIVCTAGV